MATGERTIAVGDVELTISEAGAGFTGNRGDFEMALGELADRGWHVVAPDQRGHGDSTQPTDEQAYSFDIFATDALALADAVGFVTFTVLGHSMGGMVAQSVILRAPERIEAVVLMDTSHEGLAIDPAGVQIATSIARRDGIDAVADLMAASAVLETAAYLRAVEADPAYGKRGDLNVRSSSAAMIAAMIPLIATRTDRLDELASVAVPTLVIVGEEDEPFLEPSRRMAETIPDARLAVIPGGGHSPQFEAPAAWWAALSGFLDQLP
jgi:pimeloyl-ACP methyl ester carboxylesterase